MVVAVLVGRSSVSSGVSVNGATVSNQEMRAELSAISASPTLQCYLTAIAPATYTAGGGSATMAASGAAAWANLRIQGLVIDQYVRSQLHYRPGADLVKAQASLEYEMTQAASANSLHCPGSAAQALAAMPEAMRSAEVVAQAESLYLVSRLNSTIPLTTASLRTYYNAHRSAFDTICVSIALVPTSSIRAFSTAQAAGLSVAQLAKRFSVDASAARGGAYGCFPPTSPYYAGVRADVGSTKMNTFPTTPPLANQNGTVYGLYLAATERTTTPFSQAAALVLADVRTLNANSANTVKNTLLGRAAVAIDPAFGRWGLSTTGLSVFAPALPSSSDVAGSSTLTAPSALPYQ